MRKGWRILHCLLILVFLTEIIYNNVKIMITFNLMGIHYAWNQAKFLLTQTLNSKKPN